MSWIDDTEKRKIHDWAVNYQKTYSFSGFEKEKSSYFTEFDNNNNIVELNFKNLPQLKKELESMWDSSIFEKIVVPCAVSVFKRQPTQESIMKEGELRIPDFVYAF